MPYIKPRDPPFAALRRLLLGYEINAQGLAEMLGCCWRTAKAKLERPGNLTMEDLAVISRKAHIPMAEIRDAITR